MAARRVPFLLATLRRVRPLPRTRIACQVSGAGSYTCSSGASVWSGDTRAVSGACGRRVYSNAAGARTVRLRLQSRAVHNVRCPHGGASSANNGDAGASSGAHTSPTRPAKSTGGRNGADTTTLKGCRTTDYSDWDGNGAGFGGGGGSGGVWGHWRPDPVQPAVFHAAELTPESRARAGRGFVGNEAKVAAGLGARPVERRPRTELSTSHHDIVVAALVHEQKRKAQGRAQAPGQPSCVFTCGVPGAGKTLSLHRL